MLSVLDAVTDILPTLMALASAAVFAALAWAGGHMH